MSISLQDKRILVTGGNGFIGRHVVAGLIARGVPSDAITVPDSKKCDLRVQQNVFELMPGHAVVIHLAAREGGVTTAGKAPGKMLYDNVTMGYNLMEAARTCGVEKFVSIGSVTQYPDSAEVPFREEALLTALPQANQLAFGFSKTALMLLAQAYRKEFGFDAIHLIMTNIYGPGDPLTSSHLVPSLVRQITSAKDEGKHRIEGWGSGNATRDFLFVRDAAEAIILAAEQYSSDMPVNIGSGSEIPVREFMEILCHALDFHGAVVWDASKPEGQLRRRLDVSRAAALGFQPRTTLHEGLAETVRSYSSDALPETRA